MNNKEYGVKLNLDIGKFKSKLEEIKDDIKNIGPDIKRGFKLKADESDLQNQAKRLQDNIKRAREAIYGDTPVYDLGFESIKKASAELAKSEKSLGIIRKELTIINNPFKRISNTAFTLGYRLNQLKQNPFIRIVKREADESEEEMKELDTKVVKINNNTSTLGDSFKRLGNNISTGIEKGVRNIKRFSLSLLGIHSIWTALSRAVRSYMSLDKDMSVRMQANWVAIGAIFAPIVDKIIRGLQKLVAYINVFVKAFTGGKVDLLSNALKQAEKSAKGTTKALKSMNKELSTLDELENLNFDQGGGDVDEGEFGLTDALNEIKDLDLNPQIVEKVKQIAEFIRTNLMPIIEGIKNFVKESLIPVIGQLYNAVKEGKLPWEDILVVIGLIKGGIAGGLMTAVGELIWKVLELNDAWEQQRRQQKSLGNSRINVMYTTYDRIKEINKQLQEQNLTDEQIKDLNTEKNTLLAEAKEQYKEMNREANTGYNYTKDQVDEMNEMRRKLEEMTSKKWEFGYWIELHPEMNENSWQSWANKFSSKVSQIFDPIIRGVSGVLGGGALPQLASGNVAYEPTMAQFGEYAGARSNPEITAPQNVMRETLFEALTDALPLVGNSGGGDTILYVNGKELARATYQDYQNEGNRLGNSGVAIRRIS